MEENQRKATEPDRNHNNDASSAHTDPSFLTHSPDERRGRITERIKMQTVWYDFISEDKIRHQVWKIDRPEDIETISRLYAQMPHLYIADGHHRAASAVKVGLARRAAYPGFSGSEEHKVFLSVIFPADELKLYGYDLGVTYKIGYKFA